MRVNVDKILMERNVNLVRRGITEAPAINALTVAPMADVQVQEPRKAMVNVSATMGILVQLAKSVLGVIKWEAMAFAINVHIILGWLAIFQMEYVCSIIQIIQANVDAVQIL